jgi:hypothetical protein
VRLNQGCDARRERATEEAPNALWTRIVARVYEMVQIGAPSRILPRALDPRSRPCNALSHRSSPTNPALRPQTAAARVDHGRGLPGQGRLHLGGVPQGVRRWTTAPGDLAAFRAPGSRTSTPLVFGLSDG